MARDNWKDRADRNKHETETVFDKCWWLLDYDLDIKARGHNCASPRNIDYQVLLRREVYDAPSQAKESGQAIL